MLEAWGISPGARPRKRPGPLAEPLLLKTGDHVSYQGEGRFCLRTWACRRYVKAGDVGVVVDQGTDIRPWARGESPWWRVDFGEWRVVTISDYDLRIHQYRKEVT